MFRYLIILGVMLLVVPASEAETVVVSILGSFDVRSLEVKDNENAKLEVFLQSFGDPLDGYIVALFRDGDQKELKRIESDSSGEMFFKGLPPGSYTVSLIKSKNKAKQGSMVKIGDIKLSVSGD